MRDSTVLSAGSEKGRLIDNSPERTGLRSLRTASADDPAPLRKGVFTETCARNVNAPVCVPEMEQHSCEDREALYADFQALVRRLISKYGEDPELRKDLTGEIYCRFCALLEAYDPTRGIPLKPYLVRTLTASVYTYARHHWRRQRREISIEFEGGIGDPLHTVDPSRQWDHELVMQQVLHVLPEVIAQLPARQRQVIIWRYYEGRSFEEISELLHVRLATARSLLRHGLNNLRRCIARAGLLVD